MNKAVSQICSNTAGVLPTYPELATNKLKSEMRKDVFWSDHVIYPFKCLTIKLLCVKTRSEITNKYRTPLGEDGQLTMIRLIFFFVHALFRGEKKSAMTRLIYFCAWPKFLSTVNRINCCFSSGEKTEIGKIKMQAFFTFSFLSCSAHMKTPFSNYL